MIESKPERETLSIHHELTGFWFTEDGQGLQNIDYSTVQFLAAFPKIYSMTIGLSVPN
jgi:hypothetical protein